MESRKAANRNLKQLETCSCFSLTPVRNAGGGCRRDGCAACHSPVFGGTSLVWKANGNCRRAEGGTALTRASPLYDCPENEAGRPCAAGGATRHSRVWRPAMTFCRERSPRPGALSLSGLTICPGMGESSGGLEPSGPAGSCRPPLAVPAGPVPITPDSCRLRFLCRQTLQASLLRGGYRSSLAKLEFSASSTGRVCPAPIERPLEVAMSRVVQARFVRKPSCS